ncbi:hypothetical protein Btru_070709 [Bulinus truncatus]|nr:hypothetical protein Btru_070709 [Bulinus truncatus]
MELRPKSTAAAKEQYLRVVQTTEPRTPSVVQRPTPSVPPVTLERRWLTMQADPTKAQSPTSSASATTTAAVASITPTPAPLSAPARATTTTTSSSATTSRSIPPPPSPKPSSSTSTAVSAEEPAFQTTTYAAETAKASPVGASAIPLLLLSPSPASEEALVGKVQVTPADESPVIILTQHQDETEAQEEETVSERRPGSNTSSTRKQLRRQEQTIPFLAPQLSIQEPTRERGRELERTGGRPAVHSSSEASPKRDVTDVMQFFQEQEKSLQASFLSLPKTGQRKQRSPSPKIHHVAGLQHLDNLIHLMEQLTSLKDENTRLRKRCDYLESTKVLLQAKRDLSFESSSSSSGFVTLQTKHKHHHHAHHHHHHHHHQQQQQYRQQLLETAQKTSDHEQQQQIIVSRLQAEGSRRLSRPRISSAEELDFYVQVDTSSDQRPKRPKTSMHKRSFSTGSLEVPSDFSPEASGLDTRKRSKSKPGRSIFSKSTGSKQKTKSSKWARVKKVLTGQKLYEDLGTTIRSIRDLGRSSHHPRYPVSDVPLDASPPLRVTIEDHRPTNGKASGGDVVMRTSTTESYKSADTIFFKFESGVLSYDRNESNGHYESNGYHESWGHHESNGHYESNGHHESWGHHESNGHYESNGHHESWGHHESNGHYDSNGHHESWGHHESNGHYESNGHHKSYVLFKCRR